MLLLCFIRFIPVIVILLATSSQAIFFNLAKNGILDLFNTFRAKKELKKPIPNIHHYHVHYYPLFVHSHHLSSNSIQAPSKNELDKIHIKQLESVSWSNNKLNYIPEPSIYHLPIKKSTWSTFTTYPNYFWNRWYESSIDRLSKSESDSGILIRTPRNQESTYQQPIAAKNEEESNPLMKFFEKLGYIKDAIFDATSDTNDDKSPTSGDVFNTFNIESDRNKL